MDFERSEDQAALVDALCSLLDVRFDMAAVRGLETHGGVERDRWQEPGDFGVFALGDDGMGWADAVLVFEQLGRALVPGRLVGTALAAAVVGVHGGMGYTWEVDPHLFAKRAYVLAIAFGAVEEHEEALAELV